MKSIFKSILALAMLTLFANINLATGQTVNMNRWIELTSGNIGVTKQFKISADSTNTGVRLVCGTLDTTITVGTDWTNFSVYTLNYAIKIYGNITGFECNNNVLTGLNVSQNTALTTLNCKSNSLSSLNVSTLTALEELICEFNNLNVLNLSGCTALKKLSCSGNNLASLNISNCTALIYLECFVNNLTSLDLNNCTALKELDCAINDLTSLDLHNCTVLENINCEDNDITSLNLNNCANLEELVCFTNNLSSLDLSSCTSLKILRCETNNISSIKISSSDSLRLFRCYDNNLSACGLDSIFHQLPIRSVDNKGEIMIKYNSETNPGAYSCRDTIATNRNWRVLDRTNDIVNTNYECPYFTFGSDVVKITTYHINAQIYPNPVSNNLYIECENDIKSIEIYDALGRKIISKEGHSDKTSIDFSNLGNGVYILKLRVAEGTGEFKVIKN
ncbi:MAG TPA: T9SS type A sorting domain-containing protein [Bacteroidales bacterium]|nr:T9SS type A sorting domain-containing protein [Bacteroidales bacterium]HOH22032.1 T9SS type A sorting domain-containing protein [Bacteroidales bacterium]HPZ03315.1 T9SS type A sorting domain-containing protein [Bacteroidales bacterium]HQB75106.1 T9SS type A sorting domain-containing protein [Bacteroidales bacterium]